MFKPVYAPLPRIRTAIYCWLVKGHDFKHVRGTDAIDQCGKCGWIQVNVKTIVDRHR